MCTRYSACNRHSTRKARIARGRFAVPESIQEMATVLSIPSSKCSPRNSAAERATSVTAAISSVSAMISSSSDGSLA